MSKTDNSEHARALSLLGASKGGKARAAKLTKDQLREQARRAAEARWAIRDKQEQEEGALPRETKYIGKLNLGGYVISCAVLDNRQRVLVERSMANALGRKGGGAYWQRKRASIQSQNGALLLPEYVSAKYLEKYVNQELKEKFQNPIRYENRRGLIKTGVDALVLPEICDVWISANKDGALTIEQSETAERAYVMLKGFATVGIIALIDEVTGYQEVRNRDDLQEILDKYLLPYKAAWAKRFPDSFYKAIFRLKNWNYDPKSVKRPRIVAKMTNDIVYARLAPGILQELQERTPRDVQGRRRHRFHQLLTEDIGHPKLQEHLLKVEVLMDASADYSGFQRLLQRALPKLGETFPMDIPEIY